MKRASLPKRPRIPLLRRLAGSSKHWVHVDQHGKRMGALIERSGERALPYKVKGRKFRSLGAARRAALEER